jgi:ABC-type methionine transport system permease subunit
MKTMLKVTLMIALLGSTAMSGDMGSGGFQGSTGNGSPRIKTVDNGTITTENVVLVVIKQYLGIGF